MAFDYPVLGLILKCSRPLPSLEPQPGAAGELLDIAFLREITDFKRLFLR